MALRFPKGKRVRFTANGIENIETDYPQDARYVGKAGVVETEGYSPRVRMADGYVLTGWNNVRYAAVPDSADFVLLESMDKTALYATRHADLAAAIHWLQDNGCTGEYRVLHVTEGETLTATREVSYAVKVNE
ncbi:hypothetical protein HI806_13035 [Ralstonia solanacearum]|nr:hypothetical protein BCR16_12630 [Ralstonia solanacearum FJAT-1458]QKL72114.1 hypothetical protein HI806_13035 [Ralstonia solanacearum]QKL77319.1 hypothetical protein HI805_13045 [Ralstonia solanacearum]QKL82525.1 hypothetical protein HI804_13045 [Ralstonia solanacearum]QKL87735.1 hypothetical protein HI803_13050 [Ralstonia solanacearum]